MDVSHSMITVYSMIIACAGFVAGSLVQAIVGHFRDRAARIERMKLYELGLSQGDPTRLYGIRMADKVTSDRRVTEQAVQKEIGATTVLAEEAEQVNAPWANDPRYFGCDVQFDVDRGMVIVVNENAADGPDFWEEPIDEFMQQFEEPSIPQAAKPVNGQDGVSS